MAAAVVSHDSIENAGAQAPLPVVRETVRDLLLSSAAYHTLEPEKRHSIAEALVRVCHTAASLIQEEARSDSMTVAPARSMALADPSRQPLAMAQNAGQQYSGVSAQRLASTTRDVLNAVSFPRFVTELINGVFKALVDSNQQQMNGYVDLIRNVAASTEGFGDMNMAPSRARQWLVETFPGSFEMEGGADEDTDPRDVDEEQQEAKVKMKEGGTLPSEAALRTAFGLAPGETIPSGDPETTMLPFARRALARQRQQMLATMVMLGMQRIVVESGRLTAAMRFHIDTRSAATSEDANRFNFENKSEASAKFGAGPWGVEAKMTNTIGYVSTQKNQSTEEMNTDLDLNSSVELYFKTDYLPLDRMAGKGQVDRIKVNTLNPDAEEQAARKSRDERISSARKGDQAELADLDKSLMPPPEPAKPPAEAKKPETPKTPADAKKTDAAKTPPAGDKKSAGTPAPPAAKNVSGVKSAADTKKK